MKKLFYILTTIILGLFILAAGLLLISSFSIPGVPFDTKSVLTGSMAPAIPTGSIVFIVPKDTYIEGDIITFKRKQSQMEIPVTHRIMGAEMVDGQLVFVTQGDANEYADTAAVYQDEVLGKVVGHVPFLGKLLDVARTPFGFVALIVIPALLVIVDEVRKIIRIVKEGKNKEAQELASKDSEQKKDEEGSMDSPGNT
ncbi:MAG TPA: signal peptidase I [Candidatus Paceibacterota bacterium]|nr:signal peptidase I [Candidatus Paceibacterota bacterium]